MKAEIRRHSARSKGFIASITEAASKIAFVEFASLPSFIAQMTRPPIIPALTADDGAPVMRTNKTMPMTAKEKTCCRQRPSQIPSHIRNAATIVTLYPETATVCVVPVLEKASAKSLRHSFASSKKKPLEIGSFRIGKNRREFFFEFVFHGKDKRIDTHFLCCYQELEYLPCCKFDKFRLWRDTFGSQNLSAKFSGFCRTHFIFSSSP